MLNPSEGVLKKLTPNRFKSNASKAKKGKHPILGNKKSSSNKVDTPYDDIKRRK